MSNEHRVLSTSVAPTHNKTIPALYNNLKEVELFCEYVVTVSRLHGNQLAIEIHFIDCLGKVSFSSIVFKFV